MPSVTPCEIQDCDDHEYYNYRHNINTSCVELETSKDQEKSSLKTTTMTIRNLFVGSLFLILPFIVPTFLGRLLHHTTNLR
jgi:hypothetical protein